MNLNEAKKLLFERKWVLTIDVHDIWNKYSDTFDGDYSDGDLNNFKTDIYAKLSTYTSKVEHGLGSDTVLEYSSLIDEIQTVETLDEFNDIWDQLYDFADYHDIWIRTMV